MVAANCGNGVGIVEEEDVRTAVRGDLLEREEGLTSVKGGFVERNVITGRTALMRMQELEWECGTDNKASLEGGVPPFGICGVAESVLRVYTSTRPNFPVVEILGDMKLTTRRHSGRARARFFEGTKQYGKEEQISRTFLFQETGSEMGKTVAASTGLAKITILTTICKRRPGLKNE